MRFWRFRSGRGAFGGIGVGRVLLKTGQNLCGTSSPEPQNLQNLPDPRQNLARTLSEPPRQNLRTSERDPRRFWRFWRGLGEVFGGSEVLGQNLRFCVQNLRLVLYEKDRLEAISLPTVTHALPTYGSCLATRCRFAPRADCGRTSCASTTAHMCILGLTHTLTDSCNPAKLSGRPLWQHDTGGSSSSRTGAHPHVRPGEKSSQTGCCSRIDLPRSAISTPELPLACSICVLARTILRWREAAAWRADETR